MINGRKRVFQVVLSQTQLPHASVHGVLQMELQMKILYYVAILFFIGLHCIAFWFQVCPTFISVREEFIQIQAKSLEGCNPK